MSDAIDWRKRFLHCIKTLEAAPGVPKWLVDVVRIGFELEPALAREKSADEPSDFFYPH